VADRSNGEIERLTATGIPMATFGSELTHADDLALDPVMRTVYVSDGAEHHVRVYSTQGVSLATIGAFGLDGAGLNGPRGVEISPARELHVVDAGNARVQVFGLDGTYRRSYGNTGGDDIALMGPRDIVFDAAGRALVSDPVRQRLARYDAGGAFVEFVELRNDVGRLGAPLYIAVGPEGRLYATVAFV
jgi:DNA-binding beta-propeller fold protein YncE